MGHDVYYLPRESWDESDMLFGENVYSRFDRAYQMEMYIATTSDWIGQKEFFGKFGLEVREGSNFILARRTFEKYVPTAIAIRPREGDLLYVPVMRKIFEIKFVEHELLFHTLGDARSIIFELRCETFRYSNEDLSTGIDVIDENEGSTVYNITITLSGIGNYIIGETVYQGSSLSSASTSAEVSNWNPTTRTLTLHNIKGSFESSMNVVGIRSNTSSAILTTDTKGDNVFYDHFDNKLIQNEANTFVDLSEINVFGKP
jgi:hypothetical protein